MVIRKKQIRQLQLSSVINNKFLVWRVEMNKMKTFLMVVLFTVSTLFSAVAIATTNPYVLMKQTADKLFSDIQTNQLKIKQNPNFLRTIVKNDLMPYIHVKYAGQLVLGKNLSAANEVQREKFFNAFGQFIEQSYAQVLTQYHNQKVQIENEKDVGEKSLVSIRVNVLSDNGTPPIKLDFKWRKNSKTGQWQVYDMAAEGISMVATKQTEWSGVLRQKGIDILTAQVEKSAKQPITLSK